MYDFENYTLKEMYLKGRDDAFFYKGNGTLSLIQYLSFNQKPGLIKAKMANYIMGYKIGVIELNYKSIGFPIEFDREELVLYFVNKKKKVEVLIPELKETLRLISLDIADKEVDNIIKNDKHSTL